MVFEVNLSIVESISAYNRLMGVTKHDSCKFAWQYVKKTEPLPRLDYQNIFFSFNALAKALKN